MQPVRIAPLTAAQLEELDVLYRSTRNVRLLARVQMVLLAVEQQLTAPEIAAIVRTSEDTVRRWLKRYQSEGIEGLRDVPRPGAPQKVTSAYVEQVLAAVRQRPRCLDLPFSVWTLHRLADYLAEQTGIRVTHETVRRLLKQADIVLSRPQLMITSPDPDYALKKRRSKTPATSAPSASTSITPTNSI